MTRTALLKAVYFARIGAAVVFGGAAAVVYRQGYVAFAALLAVAFLVVALSGAVQSLFWRELLAGLHHLNLRDYRAAKAHSERFLAELNRAFVEGNSVRKIAGAYLVASCHQTETVEG